MAETNISKIHTGISSEFFAAAELARRNFNVTVTFGNTKAIDLLAEKDGVPFMVQVKGIQRKKSICWNLSRDKVNETYFYIFVNLNSDTLEAPEYFILRGEEVMPILKKVESGRDYIDYNLLKRLPNCENRWDKFSI
jgi:hypothetical protein